MSPSRKNLHGPKTRQLRFETMEERIYLSATPNEMLYSDPTAEYLGECSAQCVHKWSRPNTNNSFTTPLTIEWENGQWNYDYSEWSLSLQVIVREDIDLMRKHMDEFPQDWDSEHQCYWYYLQMKDPNNEYPDITEFVFGSDYDVPLHQNSSYDATEYVLPPTYNSIAGEYENFTHLDTVREMFGLTGANQTIVVIDTGLDMNHSAFQTTSGSKVVGWYDFSNPGATELTDKNGNGTHTAAVIGSVDPNHLGVAPGADLVMLKVGGDEDQRIISSENVARALQWVIDHKDDSQFADNPITVVNISLNPGNLVRIVRERIETLQESGIIVSFMGYGAPCVDSFGPIGDPSTFNSGDYGWRYPGQFLAPGERIVSALPNGGYTEKTGAGVATAYMTGAYALVYEALVSMKGEHLHEFIEYNTNLTLQAYVHDLLKTNADSAWSSEDYRNYDRLNLLHTVQNILGKDTVGDTASEAHNLHELYSSASYADYYGGVINHVGDADYFQFTASRSGTVLISSTFVYNNGPDRAVWLDAEGNVLFANADGSLTLTVEAGQTYFFGIQSDEVGKYSLQLNLETEVEKRPIVNVKTVQNGAVSSDGQVQQSIIFEFERTINRNRLNDVNEPLTIKYEVQLDQYIETDYRDKIAHLLDGPVSLTFQPGQTSVQLEFSGLSYKEYKCVTTIWVYLLGTEGESPEINTKELYTSSYVTLVDDPGEQNIPRVNPNSTTGLQSPYFSTTLNFKNNF